MPVVKLTLAYDGTGYAGWQVQPNQPTVQAVMEEAVFKLTGMRSQVLSAGRTDAGVHALGQVASFYTTATIPGPNWRPALQNHLPYDVVIRESSIAPRQLPRDVFSGPQTVPVRDSQRSCVPSVPAKPCPPRSSAAVGRGDAPRGAASGRAPRFSQF